MIGDPTECGIYIPPYVKTCPDLTPTGWVIVGQILQLTDARHGCYASITTLAANLNIPRRTLVRTLAQLRQRGLVIRNGKSLRVAASNDVVWTTCPDPARPAVRRGVTSPKRGSPPADARPRTVSHPARAAPEQTQLDVPTAGQSPDDASHPPRLPHAPRTRRTTPLEEKLLDVSGLRNLVGTKVFPGGRFGKCLSALKELNATPEELDRYVVWWREQAMSFRRDFPSLEQISGTLHQSRLAAQGRPGPGAAAARTSSARRVDPGAMALTNPEEFNRLHQLTPEDIAENHRFLAWKNLGKPIMEAIELARQGLSPPEAETENAEC